MASSKQKTTMNKLNRERKLRERRLDKEARKVARANAAGEPQVESGEQLFDAFGDPIESFGDPIESIQAIGSDEALASSETVE